MLTHSKWPSLQKENMEKLQSMLRSNLVSNGVKSLLCIKQFFSGYYQDYGIPCLESPVADALAMHPFVSVDFTKSQTIQSD